MFKFGGRNRETAAKEQVLAAMADSPSPSRRHLVSEVIPNASGSNFTDKVKLQEQQSALQLQQNRIIEMLSANQSKSRLPQPRVSTFDGDAAEYRTFIRAFESLI